jgi:hypothetical protein
MLAGMHDALTPATLVDFEMDFLIVATGDMSKPETVFRRTESRTSVVVSNELRNAQISYVCCHNGAWHDRTQQGKRHIRTVE